MRNHVRFIPLVLRTEFCNLCAGGTTSASHVAWITEERYGEAVEGFRLLDRDARLVVGAQDGWTDGTCDIKKQLSCV